MTFTLPKRTKILWQIRILLAFAVLGAVVAFFSRYTIWFLLPASIIAGFGLLFALIYVPFYFKTYKIVVDENSICVTKGIIIKTTNIMPFPRLVFAECFTTPLSTAMKLKCVMLKAARAWMLIPEIESSDADFLLDNLKVKPNE